MPVTRLSLDNGFSNKKISEVSKQNLVDYLDQDEKRLG